MAASRHAIESARSMIWKVDKIYRKLGGKPNEGIERGIEAQTSAVGDSDRGSEHRQGGSSTATLMWRVRLVFAESKVAKLRVALENLKSTLVLLAMTVTCVC